MEKNNSEARLFYLSALLLLILASIAILQWPQDIRNRAQESTVTPTPLLRCDVPCTYNSQCPSSLFCYEGTCRNPSCPRQENCACILTPTPAPVTPTAIIPLTNTPFPTAQQNTVTPTRTAQLTVTPVASSSPTIIPTPTFEVPVNEEPQDMTLLEAIIQYIGNVLCRLFRLC